MATQPSDTLLLELETFAVPVGFRKSSAHAANAIPPDLQLWESDFALLALVRAGDSDVGSLAKAFANASDWMLLSLKAEEKKAAFSTAICFLLYRRNPKGIYSLKFGELRAIREYVENTSYGLTRIIHGQPPCLRSQRLVCHRQRFRMVRP